MQLDQMTLLREKINKVVLLTKKLKDENDSLKKELGIANQKLRDLESTDLATRFDFEEKEKAIKGVLALLDGMLSEDESTEDFSLEKEEEALKYLAGDQEP